MLHRVEGVARAMSGVWFWTYVILCAKQKRPVLVSSEWRAFFSGYLFGELQTGQQVVLRAAELWTSPAPSGLTIAP